MAKDLAIVLNSGSLSSATVTALAAQRYRPVMLHAVAGGPHEPDPVASRRRVAFDQQVAHFKPYREHVVSMPFLSLLQVPGSGGSGGSGGASRQPIGGSADPRQQAPLAPHLLALLPLMAAAGRFAAHHQAAAIYLGLRVGGSADELAQATEYVQVWTELLQLPCGMGEVEFHAPLLELEPWQVVDLGVQVNAPLERSWSCDGNEGEPCWACRGCRTREIAFQQAGKPDPIRTTRRA